MQHAYDFYKPDLTSEYPVVDGHYSVSCYTEAVDACYKGYNKRETTLQKALLNGSAHVNGNGVHHEADSHSTKTPLDRFDYMSFHAPTCKLVAKSYARLLYNDYLANPSHPAFADVPSELLDMDYKKSITDKLVEKTFMALTKKRFQERVQPSIEVPTMCGNMYCASVYGGLVSLLSNVDSSALQGKRIGVFSYGSGLASSLFSIKVRGSTEAMQKVLNIKERLAARKTVAPEVYDEVSAVGHKSTRTIAYYFNRCANFGRKLIYRRTIRHQAILPLSPKTHTTSQVLMICSAANMRSKHR
jgi:hydroxymethylglutaryl-CoA synthase